MAQTDTDPQANVRFAPLDLAVIVPTFNEAVNARKMVQQLVNVLAGLSFEIIFVDDNSPDGTSDLVRRLAAEFPQVRCIQRVGRRGLSGAVIEGIMATTAPVAAVIDGDMQHDETLLPTMLETLRQEDVDMVVGSRYIDGGGFGDWSTQRRKMSQYATTLSKRLTGVVLSDPMSGFFMLKTDSFRERVGDLTGVGYKILLDILSARGRQLDLHEVPYEFRTRQAGESKLDNRVMLEFVELLISRTIGRWIPTKFIMFSMVGALGVLVHLAILSSLFGTGATSFVVGQSVATLVAMTVNFFVNNSFTYFDRQLRGRQLLPGWVSFCIASSFGALVNVGLADFLYESASVPWFFAAVAGIVAGATLNYAVTALYTWKDTR